VSDSALLAKAVRAAVGNLGLMASSDLISRADELLKYLSGFVGLRADALRRVRSARSEEELFAALDWVRELCREDPNADAKWTLIGAIAAD
jgi:hypothetical protein